MGCLFHPLHIILQFPHHHVQILQVAFNEIYNCAADPHSFSYEDGAGLCMCMC
jgi:hypothetical protein